MLIGHFSGPTALGLSSNQLIKAEADINYIIYGMISFNSRKLQMLQRRRLILSGKFCVQPLNRYKLYS